MKMHSILFFLIVCFFSLESYAEISMKDLEFKDSETKVDSKSMGLIEARQGKLQTHQKLGMATMALMLATMLTSDEAKSSDVHKYLGMATGAMYWTTAYYSLSAPDVEGTKDSGSSKIHKSLAWIHVPLMAVVPVLGYLRKEDLNHHRKSSGIVKSHESLASVAFLSFMAAGLTMYFDFSF